IDLIDISGGVLGYIVKGRNEAGYFSDVSKEIKKISKIPVILTGGVKTLEEADNLIEKEACDMVGVGRKLFANPYWADDEFSNK
ncbi:MAG: tRNA-dihydrouridine synthase, partial [Fusobacterium sp.]|nr:tRNA-dihydrouridine synthase [Fusobacterium sp.]